MEKLESSFFYNLEKTVKVYRQYFQNQLKMNGFDITLDQWLTLRMITEFPEASQNEIAEKVFKDKGSITRIINLLKRKEYIFKMPHPNHVKKSNIQLTSKGQETILRLNIIVPEIRRKALLRVDTESIEGTMKLLYYIGENCKK
jgi:DNA-binding MarR family transcriptional regulator